MPKRRNPFVDSVPLQFKTHVGVKELASGTMHEELMKEVYERTQGKLFGAVKGNSDLNANHMQSTMDLAPSAEDLSFTVDSQQMTLDGAGHLVYPSPSWTTPSLGVHHQFGGSEQSSPQSGSTMSQQTDMKFGHFPEVTANMWSAQSSSLVTDFGQKDTCGRFSSWMHSDSSVFRQYSPVTSLPATEGQLRLDSKGHLTAPLHSTADSSMDCDTDPPQPSFSGGLAMGEGGRKSTMARGGRGLERWGFMSGNASGPKVQPQPSSVKCQTCRHVPSSVRCQFCERWLCGGCGRLCDSCQLLFCTLCSTLDYNTSAERAFCLGCAG
ncbi:hypothetical protein ACOMHN_006448 [Nucella lapillus]